MKLFKQLKLNYKVKKALKKIDYETIDEVIDLLYNDKDKLKLNLIVFKKARDKDNYTIWLHGPEHRIDYNYFYKENIIGTDHLVCYFDSRLEDNEEDQFNNYCSWIYQIFELVNSKDYICKVNR